LVCDSRIPFLPSFLIAELRDNNANPLLLQYSGAIIL